MILKLKCTLLAISLGAMCTAYAQNSPEALCETFLRMKTEGGRIGEFLALHPNPDKDLRRIQHATFLGGGSTYITYGTLVYGKVCVTFEQFSRTDFLPEDSMQIKAINIADPEFFLRENLPRRKTRSELRNGHENSWPETNWWGYPVNRKRIWITESGFQLGFKMRRVGRPVLKAVQPIY